VGVGGVQHRLYPVGPLYPPIPLSLPIYPRVSMTVIPVLELDIYRDAYSRIYILYYGHWYKGNNRYIAYRVGTELGDPWNCILYHQS